MSVPAYLLVPDGRRGPAAGAGRAGLPRARAGQVAGRRPDAHRHAQRGLRAATRPPRLRRAGARPALLRRAAGLEPRGPLRLRHQPRPRRHGRVEPAGAERLGPAALARRAGAAPAGRPGAPRHGRHLLRRHGHALHGGRRHPRGGVGGERLLLLVGREPQNAVEHVRLADPVRHAGEPGARGPGRAGGAAAPAGRVRHGRTTCSPSPRRRSRCAARAWSTSSSARATAWCTTSSRAGTSGTARRPCPSWTTGSGSRRADELSPPGRVRRRGPRPPGAGPDRTRPAGPPRRACLRRRHPVRAGAAAGASRWACAGERW